MLNSISFYPALIALSFLLLSFIMIAIDFSELGKSIKASMKWLRLKDASTARTIVSVIAAGILSLTVFSFSMVMVVLNQAASQLSNRIVDKLIGNRFQQIILGFYIGTIVYALFLLSSIRDIDSGIYVPALSTYLLIGLTIADIFLFIYFLHYITQSIKYNVIINRIHRQTLDAMESSCRLKSEPSRTDMPEGTILLSPKSGIFDGFDKKGLVSFLQENQMSVKMLHSTGTYVLAKTPFLATDPGKEITGKQSEELFSMININSDQSIQSNFYYGFRQLTEIAIKALSPGINDPGTAVESLRALSDLLAFRLKHFPDNNIRDKGGQVRVITVEQAFEDLFQQSFLLIWNHGKNERIIIAEMLHLLKMLQERAKHEVFEKMIGMINTQSALLSNSN